MTLEEFVEAAKALAPFGVEFDSEQLYQEVNFTYTDSSGDSVTIAFCLNMSVQKRIVIDSENGSSWYFTPAFCQWLGMLSALVGEVEV